MSGSALRASDLKPGYIFYGEEMFFGRRFLRELQAAFGPSEAAGFETFSLPRTPWSEILDVARTLPFAFSPWRVLVVEADPAEIEDVTDEERTNIKAYFAAPTPRTALVVFLAGRSLKTHPLTRLFSALPRSAVAIVESKRLKPQDLEELMNEKLASEGKGITFEAGRYLIEASGNDPEFLGRELDKLVAYVGERKVIDVPDVDLLSTGVRELLRWELSAALERGDIEGSLRYIKRMFDEVKSAELIVLSQLADFFRDLLLAKAGLRENRSREEIFAELRPRIMARFGKFYWDKLREFFTPVDRLGDQDIGRLVDRLERVDVTIKTAGGDTDRQTLLEAVVFEYGRAFRSSGFIS
jgi:DNA polymerase-3 subunit delta